MTTLDAKDSLLAYIEDYAKLGGGAMKRKYGDDPMLGFENVVRRARAALALPPQPVEVTEEMVEAAAQAIYAALPNFGMEWRPNTAGGSSQVRVDDAWEDAPDRHEDCRRQVRAVLALSRPSGDGIRAGRAEPHELLAAAVKAMKALDDFTNVNETEFTGWGDGDVPAGAEWWRVKSGQALRALEEIRMDPPRALNGGKNG